jgi:hypothetical protein
MNTTQTLRNASLIALGCLAAWSAQAQDRLVVPLSDAARPAVLEVNTLGTTITVSATDGKEVVIVARQNAAAETDRVARDNTVKDVKEAARNDARRGPEARTPPRAKDSAGDDEASTAGLHRIPNTSIGLTATEENNIVTVNTDFTRQSLTLDISVPRNTSVRLKTVNGGDMTVTGVRGEHELSNVNGRIVANDIAGSLVASTTNGTIRASFTDVTAGKPMSFSTFNGDVDVTFPAKLAATLRVSSGHGELFTDFDAAVQPQPPVVTQGGQNGRYEVRLERETVVLVGKGGPDIRFKTFNGNVMVRKR